nr:MAG TPA: hypothetical protein [Caudoviricetes sp.]
MIMNMYCNINRIIIFYYLNRYIIVYIYISIV